MAMVNAMCLGCGAHIQLDDRQKTSFCMYCGSRMTVGEAVEYYKKNVKEPEPPEEAAEPEATDALQEIEDLLTNNSFTKAENLCKDLIKADNGNCQARWGLIRALTHNLEPKALKSPDDFFWKDAQSLFSEAPTELSAEWTSAYASAYLSACKATADSYDPRVYIEVSVYKWSTKENAFENPVDRTYPIESHIDNSVRAHLYKLADVLDEERRDEFEKIIDNKCEKIAAYFRSGFDNVDELQTGDFKKLLGLWAVKNSTDESKTEVIKVTRNGAGVVYLESMRTSISRLDYFRFVEMNPEGSLTCRELRRYPSRSGAGGDFMQFSQPKPFQQLFALYDYLLVLPNAVFSRTDAAEIPGYDRAVAFQQKCYPVPCFIRDGAKSFQIRPATENHNTAEPSKKVSNCYIATAVYGDVEHPQVLVLRRFRDDILNQSRIGRRLSSAYYTLSPPLAEKLKDAKSFNTAVRSVLNGVVRILDILYPN